tara:strand:+ start:976 stop:1605 length:630 start_codon:yes stop_codon:yes gene_type:complete
MEFDIINLSGQKVNSFKADDSVFSIEPNISAVRQAVLSEMANMRQGTHSSKNRAKVNGGGKKPWKQKGRGVARAGTIRSPLWRGGGTVFGPEPHKYQKKVSRKLSRLARISVLSSKAAEGNLRVIDELELKSHKTTELLDALKMLDVSEKKITILTARDDNKDLELAARNLSNLQIVPARVASTYELINCEVLIVDKDAMVLLTDILNR